MSSITRELIRYKSKANGTRGVIKVNKRNLHKGGPHKPLTVRITRSGGRNNRGVITSRGIGGGARKLYRIIDFKRKGEQVLKVLRIEYDPCRTANIALTEDEQGKKSYVLAPNTLQSGMTIRSGGEPVINTGNTYELRYIPDGTIICNVEAISMRGGSIARAAGTHCSLVGKEGGRAILELPSKAQYKVSLDCRATIGEMSNKHHQNEFLGSAGENRRRGRVPLSRGRAKNPVDHAQGGRTRKLRCSANGRMLNGERTSSNVGKRQGKLVKRRTKG